MASTKQSTTIWKQADEAGVFRVAIAGDFLPAASVAPGVGSSWKSEAQAIGSYFQDVDMSLINLECAVDVGMLPARSKLGLGATFAGPGESLDYLLALKTELVSVANNHTYDYGEPGLESTFRALAKRNIRALGAGKSLGDAPDLQIRKTAYGFSIGFWAAARGLPELCSRKSIGIEPATLKRGRQALSALDSAGCQLKIALLHTGLEHTNYPDPADVRLMDSLATEGFDIVAACHSHRTSGYKLLRRSNGQPAFCFYGLGSLTSCIAYSEREQEGLLVVAHANSQGSLAAVDLRPVSLSSAGWAAIPEAKQAQTILDRIQFVAREITDNSFAANFYADTSKNVLSRQWRDVRVAFERGGFAGVIQKCARLRGRHLRRIVHQI